MPPLAKAPSLNFTKLAPVLPSYSQSCTCNHCGLKMSAKSLKRKIAHLEKCAPYKRWRRDNPDAVEDKATAGPSSRSDGNGPQSMPSSEEDKHNRAAARVVVAGGHPLTLFDKAYNPWIVEYIQGYDKSFTGVDRKPMAGLVKECDEQVEAHITPTSGT